MILHSEKFFLNPTISIMWLEGDGNYTRVHLENGHTHLLPYTLKFLNGKLPDFVRVHKSSLVNPSHAEKLLTNGYRDYAVRLSNGVILPVSAKRLPQASTRMNLPVP